MFSGCRPFFGLAAAAALLAAWCAASGSLLQPGAPPAALPDSDGAIATVEAHGAANAAVFAEAFGPGGRACGTCHRAGADWSITPVMASAEFRVGSTVDPLFSPIDGTNAPTLDRFSTAARRAASSLLLEKGLIRMQRSMPAGASFTLVKVDDPWRYASANALSLYRRPLPVANLAFETTLMWDGRETGRGGRVDRPALERQALDAMRDHSQELTAPSGHQVTGIVGFEEGLFAAQSALRSVGALDAAGGRGGPALLAAMAHENWRRSAPGFDLYAAWLRLPGSDAISAARRSIARGEVIFDSRRFAIRGVDGYRGPSHGACASCHDAPDVGTSRAGLLMDVGISSAELRTADLPLYTFLRRGTAEQITTSDPGRALVTGRWRDMNCFKVPGLRGLAARAPYFHNGCAASIPDAVDLLDRRFTIGLTPRDKRDLCAFLSAL
ncbi:MAG: hypothetical protein KGJ62_02170 [Armatimonadetes bacterium]|nr:hypothetical protein [Armatimonadota bacterium]MDE2206109.1 hypothetical protein [Armatimonadota bacterium]